MMGFIKIAKLWGLFNVIASFILVGLTLISAIGVGSLWRNFEYEILILLIYLMMNIISSLILLHGLKCNNHRMIMSWLMLEIGVFGAKLICFGFIAYDFVDLSNEFARNVIPIFLLLTNLGYHVAFGWVGLKCREHLLVEIDIARTNERQHIYEYEHPEEVINHQLHIRHFNPSEVISPTTHHPPPTSGVHNPTYSSYPPPPHPNNNANYSNYTNPNYLHPHMNTMGRSMNPGHQTMGHQGHPGQDQELQPHHQGSQYHQPQLPRTVPNTVPRRQRNMMAERKI